LQRQAYGIERRRIEHRRGMVDVEADRAALLVVVETDAGAVSRVSTLGRGWNSRYSESVSG
jgi:hypothetical protein